MKGIPTHPWGKFNRETQEWHPLSHHCIDVGVCFEALLTQDVLRRRLACLGRLGDLSPVQIARLSFLAALHDWGKNNSGFCLQLMPGRCRAGHVGPAMGALNDARLRRELSEALGVNLWRGWFESPSTFLEFMIATLSHHGRPAPLPESFDRRMWEPRESLDPVRGVRDLCHTLCAAFFPAFVESRQDVLPSHAEFQHAFSGLVMLADWLASDTRFFPFSESWDEDRLSFARRRAREAMELVGLDVHKFREVLRVSMPTFDEIFGFPPHPLQHAIETLPLAPAGGVVVLEAETGSGKTEAAFRHFMRLQREGAVDGMYFALPTRSAASQIFERIRKAASAAYGRKSPAVVLAVPGYLRVDDQQGEREGFRFSVLWPDHVHDAYRFRGWAVEHPKRYFAAPILVGTVDQVLLSALQVSHSHLRASALLRHLLVIDEVHASDPYMTAILEEVLRFHLRAGGHALLMSATLGSVARSRLLGQRRTRIPDQRTAENVPYPLLASHPGDRLVSIPHCGRPKEVRVAVRPESADYARVAELALEGAQSGARVLILRNLVRDAVRTQSELERLAGGENPLLFRCQNVVTLHHGRFASEDRQELDRALESRFGSGSTEAGVVVATQTVEQSLDIDFDWMLTDLCPGDVFLQRLGRLHRHVRTRPRGFENPGVVVLVPAERCLSSFLVVKGAQRGLARGPHGYGTVYPDLRVLEATLRLIDRRPVLAIPQMNRYIVESVTHPTSLEMLGEEWREHGHRIEGIRCGQGQLARGNLVRRDQPFGSLDSLFSEIADEIGTRLGEHDRIVHFPRAIQSPFGTLIRAISVPSWMAKGVGEATEAVDIQAESDHITFVVGSAAFKYTRHGLGRIHAQSPQGSDSPNENSSEW